MFYFHAYDQLLKVFHAYFLKKIKSYFYYVLKLQNGYPVLGKIPKIPQQLLFFN